MAPLELGRRSAQHGYALVAVLWMSSALMLLVSALVFQARTEVRAVSAGRDLAMAEAQGDAVIAMVVRAITADPPSFVMQRTLDMEFEGESFKVVVTPLTGLVSINAAPQSLLAALFQFGAGVDAAAAQVLAQRVIDWRDPDSDALPAGAENPQYVAAGVPFRARNGPFEAPEDLLQVLGVDFEIYDKIRGLVTSDGSSRGVNPVAAPAEVLLILAQGNASLAGKVAVARDAGQVNIDTTSLMQEFIDQSSSKRFRLQAYVPGGARGLSVRTVTVDVSPPVNSRLPWRILRTEEPIGVLTPSAY